MSGISVSADAPASAAAFLAESGWADAVVRPLAGDASFRHYFRVHLHGRTAVLMDAPPTTEDVRPFFAIGRHLAGLGLSVPEIMAVDAGQGLMLLEDLGDMLLARAIAAGPSGGGGHEAELYEAATDVLVHCHRQPVPATVPGLSAPYPLPRFGSDHFINEVNLFTQWYLPAVQTGQSVTGPEEMHSIPASVAEAFNSCWAPLAAVADLTGDRLVQRDFHSPNLLWLPDRIGVRRIGVLDFQDSLRGSPAYDLVSLLQDPRRDVPDQIEVQMLAHYLDRAEYSDREAFRAAYAILGAQRMTRILGVFVRLARRDGKPGYLKWIARGWGLLERNLQHPALAEVNRWFADHVPAERRAAFWADAT